MQNHDFFYNFWRSYFSWKLININLSNMLLCNEKSRIHISTITSKAYYDKKLINTSMILQFLTIFFLDFHLPNLLSSILLKVSKLLQIIRKLLKYLWMDCQTFDLHRVKIFNYMPTKPMSRTFLTVNFLKQLFIIIFHCQ